MITDNVFVDNIINSGIAIINVDNTGENQIMVISGANGNLDNSNLDRFSYLLTGPQVPLLHLLF